jgi:RNA polymerase sigma-70 factor (ECF subfamily)
MAFRIGDVPQERTGNLDGVTLLRSIANREAVFARRFGVRLELCSFSFFHLTKSLVGRWFMTKELALMDAPSPPEGLPPFADVVNAHWSAVYRFLYYMTGTTHDTEDLTQETFLRALRKQETFQAGTKLRSWLLRIAANAFYDLRRKGQRVKQRPLPDNAAGPAQRPERGLEAAEQGELLKAALEELSETTRLVFHLRTQEELSFREIGDLAGITEEAARWHMHQARTKLMSRLAGKL